MLSVENPPPDDPTCPTKRSPSPWKSSNNNNNITGTSTSNTDDGGHGGNQDDKLTGLSPQVDGLCRSLPKFSIRDYVFAVRKRDIKQTWPFSRENLQRCLKHGLKDPLPPFDIPNSLRNRPTSSCLVENDDENVDNLDEKQMVLSEQLVSSSDAGPRWNSEEAQGCQDSTSYPSIGEQDLVSNLMTYHSQSHLESASTTKHRLSEVERDLHMSDPVGKQKRTHEVTQPSSSRKCRLVVKMGSNTDRNTAGPMTSDCAASSEVISSKVCPVCQAFSSSSNTTLNAHIDQCLSVEPVSKWKGKSDLGRPRVKPRKMRLMVDICATAPVCTLEDLDRRNGTDWAKDTSLLTTPTDVISEGEKQKPSSSPPIQASGNSDSVYIDANGTKFRILSSVNTATPSLKSKVEIKLKKPPGKRYGSKFLSHDKRSGLDKHQHFKVPPRRKELSSLLACSPKANRREEAHPAVGDSNQEEKLNQTFKSQVRNKSPSSGTIRKWIRCKRTGSLQKRTSKDNHWCFQYKVPARIDPPAGSDESYLDDSNAGRTHAMWSSGSFKDCMYSVKLKEISGPLNEPEFGVKERKRMRDHGDAKNSSLPLKPKTGQLIQDKIAMNQMTVDKIPTGGSSLSTTRTSSEKRCAFSSKGRRRPILGKNISLSVKESTCQVNPIQRGSAMERSHVHRVAQDLVTWPTKVSQQCAMMRGSKENCPKTMIENACGSEIISEIQPQEGIDPVGDEHHDISEISQSAPCSSSRGVVRSTNYTGRVSDKDQGCNNQNDSIDASVPNMKITANAFDAKFHALESSDEYQGHLFEADALNHTVEAGSPVDIEMLSADTFGNEGAYTDVDLGEDNSYHMFDPIPIPGPPGSYLPSPRAMESEIVQGSSSLTSSRFQSCHDFIDMVDGDSLNSTVSTLSNISCSTEAKSELKNPNLEMGKNLIQEKVRPGCGYVGQNASSSFQEGICWRGSLDLQESDLLKRRMTAADASTQTSSVRQNVCSKETSEKLLLLNSGVRLQGRRDPMEAYSGVRKGQDAGAASELHCVPVLRLMGKNLMVMSNDKQTTHTLKTGPGSSKLLSTTHSQDHLQYGL